MKSAQNTASSSTSTSTFCLSQRPPRKQTDKKILLKLDDYKDLQEYLGHEIEEVKFSKFHNNKKDGYTPLVIDGAYGVGKTQQAFALLKKHGYLIYVVMTKTTQTIYEDVDDLLDPFSFEGFQKLCDNAVAGLKKAAEDKKKGTALIFYQ